jgi:biotin transport system substrate-specific component
MGSFQMAELATRSDISTLEALASGSLAKKAAIVGLGSIFLAVMSQIAVPFFPVAMTLQTLAVMLIGVTFGFRLATATVVLYILEGAAGLPVFTGFANLAELIVKPYTSGYIAGFLVAAAFMGFMADRGVTKTWIGMIATLFVGEVIIFALGIAVLGYLIGFDAALQSGLYPFLLGDALKLALAALLAKGVLKGASRFAQL